MIELVDVAALTLLNPWPRLVTHHGKNVENRVWMPPETLDRFLIHAGKGWDRSAAEYAHQRYGITPDTVHTSAIVAVARLAHGCNSSRWSDTLRCGCGIWAMAGQCHWVLNEVTVLPEPVPCSGNQKLWRPPADVLAAVERQLNDVCGLCHQALAVETWKGVRICAECAEYGRYDDSLTPEERRAEHEAMAQHADETAGQP